MDSKAIDISTKKDRYYVAGRGFAGLAISFYLKKLKPDAQVTLFDPHPLKESASGAASGLLEPIGGRLAARSLRASEAIEATRELLEIVSQHLNRKVYKEGGILHPPINQEQEQLFRKKVLEYPEYFGWTEENEFLVKEGINVFSGEYLEGLFCLVTKMGVEFIAKKVVLDPHVKRVFLAVGDQIEHFVPGQFRFTRGQAMQVRKKNTQFIRPKVHKGYVALDSNKDLYHVGSTYERTNLHLPPDKNAAIQELKERNKEILPEIEELEVVTVKAGTRVFSRQEKRLPEVILVTKNCYALTALGSKGLLYHALYAKEMCEQLS